jgi:hypothetical protein
MALWQCVKYAALLRELCVKTENRLKYVITAEHRGDS